MMTYSVIIPAFNPSSLLLRCLRSLSKMDFDKKRFEVIIVDDGSMKVFLPKLDGVGRINLKILKYSSSGAAGARNIGIEKAQKEVIVFLDQDVLVNSRLLQHYERAFKLSKADVVQGNIWEQINNKGLAKIHAKWRRLVFMQKVGENNGLIKTIITRNVAVKKKVLNKIKEKYGYVFNESFRGTGGEDRELGYRIHDSGFRIFLESKAIVKHNDPNTLTDILIQKLAHAQGDAKHGIAERLVDFRNFQRTVIIPTKRGIPLYFAFLLWLSHVMGAESQRIMLYLNSLNEKTYFFLKRLIDIIGSTFSLIVGFPLLAVISVLIKLDSKGPVIFKQKRVGAGNWEFEMFKFRTMVIDAETILQTNSQLMDIYKNSSYKIKDDPRVTRVGKLLRKYSLDELPQLVNILKGEMSIVGPRAYKKDEIENQLKIHPELRGYSKKVMNIKPGLTGIWQTSGRSEIGFEKRMMLDYEYQKKKSFLFDLLLILKTFPAVLKSKGAW